MKTFFASLLLVCPAVQAFSGHELEGRDLAEGKALYADYCAACHGANLEGQPDWTTPNEDGTLPAPPHDETGHTWHHDNGVLFLYTQLGGQGAAKVWGIDGFTSAMPAFEDVLSEDQIWNVLAYIRSTWPKRIQAMQDSRNPAHD